MSYPYICKQCGREMWSIVESMEFGNNVYCKQCYFNQSGNLVPSQKRGSPNLVGSREADVMAAEIIQRAENGDPSAQCDVGAIAYKAKNYNEAKKWLTESAMQGNATAQTNLGIMFEFGDGIPKDHSEAARWYELAAKQGDPRAMFNLSTLYREGKGVSKDLRKAFEWCHMAVASGYTRAQVDLGFMYQEGVGTEPDANASVKWYRAAASQEDPKGLFNLGVMYYHGTGVPQDLHEALKLFERRHPKGLQAVSQLRERLKGS